MAFQSLRDQNFCRLCSELFSPGRHASRKRVCSFPCREAVAFTLLEILIAMFIFAIVLSTIYTSYTGTFRIVDDTESQTDIYEMARIALERMHEDLESVYILENPKSSEPEELASPVSEFLGEDKEIEGKSADLLRFVSTAHLIFSEEDKASGTAEIAYYVEEGHEGDGFVLYRSDTPPFEEKPEEGTGGLVLCDSLVSVNFAYYDDEGEVSDKWDSSSDEFKNKIPRMVSILLEFQNKSDPETPFKFFTTVALPAGQG
jgi:general secretion pathway protein J